MIIATSCFISLASGASAVGTPFIAAIIIVCILNMLGGAGRVWMIIVAIMAAVSTQNSIIGCVSEICCGMAKIELLPAVFQKKISMEHHILLS